jgi:uncharacterized membrane protein YdfJ with MMPL/SSD domain
VLQPTSWHARERAPRRVPVAVAVILDATVIRCVLVPASMSLLGDLNWYFPRWLEWLPRIDIEGAAQVQHIRAVGATAPLFADAPSRGPEI